MALTPPHPPPPRSARNQPPPPPGSLGLAGPDLPTGHSSRGPGRTQSTPGPLAPLLLFPLFLPPPSPIRIVCLNSTLTNMDSSGLGRAVITARPPPGSRIPPPPISAELNAAPRWETGGVGGEGKGCSALFPSTPRAPSTPSSPRDPEPPGPEVCPVRGLDGSSEDPPRQPAGLRVNTGARRGAAPWGRGGRGGAPPPARPPARRPYYLSLSWSSVPGSG